MDGIGVSGYRVFFNENLQNVKEKIELETGKKATLSSLQKELSKLWNDLSEEEKQMCREKAQALKFTTGVNPIKASKRQPSISPFQNYRIKNILSLDPKMPKFTSGSITLINDAMASFLEQLAQLTDRFVKRIGGNYPIRPHHIVGGINQGDESVSFLKESIEYVHRERHDNNRESIKRPKEVIDLEDDTKIDNCKITTYFKQKV